jgi:hypothetical protein
MLVNEDATEPSSWLRSQSRMRGFTKMVRVGTTGFPTVVEKGKNEKFLLPSQNTRWIASIYGDRTQKGGTE